MNDNYLQLLKYLEEWGIDREVPVDHVLYDWFKNQINVEPDEHINNISARIVHFVDEMHEGRHIRLNKIDTTIEGITTWYFSARLTSWGLEYLNNYRLLQSNLSLNKSTALVNSSIISANKIGIINSRIQTGRIRIQTVVFIFGAIFAFVSLLIAAIALYLQISTNQDKQAIKRVRQDSVKSQKEEFFSDKEALYQNERGFKFKMNSDTTNQVKRDLGDWCIYVS